MLLHIPTAFSLSLPNTSGTMNVVASPRNVIITPHAAGWFYLEKTLDNIVAIANENLRAYLSGGTFVHVVDKKMGY